MLAALRVNLVSERSTGPSRSAIVGRQGSCDDGRALACLPAILARAGDTHVDTVNHSIGGIRLAGA